MLRSNFLRSFWLLPPALLPAAKPEVVNGDLVLENESSVSGLTVNGNLRIAGNNNTVQNATFHCQQGQAGIWYTQPHETHG